MTAKEELKEYLENLTPEQWEKIGSPERVVDVAEMISKTLKPYKTTTVQSGGVIEQRKDPAQVREEVHRHKDGSVTIKTVIINGKRKPRRKRRSNHGMRRALIRQHRSR